MNFLIKDKNRNIVLLVNDFNLEFAIATDKLSEILHRKLEIFILVDEKIKNQGLNKSPDTQKHEITEIVCNYEDPTSIARSLRDYQSKILVVNASSERNQPYYQKLIPHLPHLLTPTESSITWSTIKSDMRRMFHAYDRSFSPQFIELKKFEKLSDNASLSKLNFPVIIKPAGLASSVLVKKANNISQAEEIISNTFQYLEAAYIKNRGRGRPSLLIEEFIDGDMYSIDAYIDNNGKIWELPPVKITTAASLGIEGYYGYKIDSFHGLNKKQLIGLSNCAHMAIRALGLKNSVAHIELFDSSNGWKIIELGPRAGGYRQEMYSISYGVDHALNELLLKVGKEPIISDRHLLHSQVINIYAETEGIINSIKGFEKAIKLPNIYSLNCHAKVGDKALFCGNGGHFIIDGIIKSTSQKEADKTSERIRSLIKIEVN